MLLLTHESTGTKKLHCLYVYSYGTLQLKFPQKSQGCQEKQLWGVNFCRTLSFPINYRMFDSNFCHPILRDPLGCISLKSHPALDVLSLEGGVCCSVKYSLENQVAFLQTLNTQKSWLIHSLDETGLKGNWAFLLFVCLVPGVLQSVYISNAARGLICTNSLIISNDIILGFHIAA